VVAFRTRYWPQCYTRETPKLDPCISKTPLLIDTNSIRLIRFVNPLKQKLALKHCHPVVRKGVRLQSKLVPVTCTALLNSFPCEACNQTPNRLPILLYDRPSNPSHLKLTNRSFYHTAVALWSNLPIELRTYVHNTNSFALSTSQLLEKRKTYLFHLTFPP
jgi:hypothetical protein